MCVDFYALLLINGVLYLREHHHGPVLGYEHRRDHAHVRGRDHDHEIRGLWVRVR